MFVSVHRDMKYRGSTEIMDSILRSTKSGATKTHIMYQAYLSYIQLQEYLTLLQQRELIKYYDDKRMFQITERGLLFMNAYEEISQLIPRIEVRKSSLMNVNS
ncbi:MAG: winged helix-turn-helix domain-containing protein [Nitrososphaerales archaeon]